MQADEVRIAIVGRVASRALIGHKIGGRRTPGDVGTVTLIGASIGPDERYTNQGHHHSA
ncbi:MAG TPA: hypothetical protein VNH39_11210 [Steroidobacteraceae bacterium]|nr:hypothetical protein [Steroidobacteraceae bacterium]